MVIIPKPTTAYLQKGGIVCIEEVHTDSSGRLLTQALLQSELVHTLFIEYSPDLHPQRYGWYRPEKLTPLIDDLQKMLGKSPKEINEFLDAISCFSDLIQNDAKPDLKQLTIQALQANIRVVPVDPLNQLGFNFEAIEERNIAAAFIISRHFQQNRFPHNKGAILLMGANHFAKAEENDIAALLIREQIAPVTTLNLDPAAANV